ncbi:TetR/AcrR family transcriptional regulator [Butyrivibrio sp. AE2015]|uniref:TetR/AcrR family transcriptional regulator n=1 Tax=Butyrivibrio sp. AE2015 TaxID=1280663 RepID=UPI0003B3CE3D|nr:TetR/AcrR family transcriptional regulator [Butyrivibrio sp. AE2015]
MRKTNTKEKIHKAFLGMLEEEKLSKISICELCEKAAINRTTFYNHYGSQHDVYNEIIHDFLQETSYKIIREMGEKADFTTSLTNVLHVLKKEREFIELLKRQGNEYLLKNFIEAIPQFDEMILSRLPDSMNEIQKKSLASFIQYGSAKVILDWVEDGCKISPEEETKVLLDIYGLVFRMKQH